jgi:hypothetical protein
MEDDPLIAWAAGSGIGIGPVTEPVKQAFDAFCTAYRALDDALLALEAYAPQHAEKIVKIRDRRR